MFKQNKRQKMFQRILITSSLTIIATVITLIVLITNYYADRIIQSEMNLNKRTMERINDYFVNKQNDWDGLIRDLYVKEELIEDLTNVLHYEYDEYMRLRLENYAKQTSFTPNDTFAYFNSFFAQDDDVNAIILQSSRYSDLTYKFIYNHGRWNQSLNEMNPYEQNGRVDPRFLQNTFAETLSINNPATLDKMGYLTIYYSTDEMERILYSEEGIVQSSFFLVDENQQIVYEDNHGIPERFVDELREKDVDDTLEFKNKKFIVQAMDHINDYTAYSVIPEKELSKLTFVRGTMWMLIIVTLIIALVLTYFIIRNYSARIEQIDTTMRDVQKGDLSVRIPPTKYKDELATIATSLNTMLDDINDYIEEVYVLELKQQQAELKALQSQINPHFLFNTLETIRMSAVIDGSKTSGKMIYHLSRLLRYSLDVNESVALQAEFENAKQYLQLIQLQHPEQLDYTIDLPNEAASTYVQRLILQPIVENYIIHGFRKEKQDNHVAIRAEIQEEMVWITIEDNGTGIAKEKLHTIRQQFKEKHPEEDSSIGMKNVHQRLRLKYGAAYGLRIESEEDIGTKVTLIIPLGGM